MAGIHEEQNDLNELQNFENSENNFKARGRGESSDFVQNSRGFAGSLVSEGREEDNEYRSHPSENAEPADIELDPVQVEYTEDFSVENRFRQGSGRFLRSITEEGTI